MGARSSPGAGETIHGPVAYPGAGGRGCEARAVSTRSRTVAPLLSTPARAPAVLAGCGGGDTDGATPRPRRPSARRRRASRDGDRPPTGDTAEDGATDAPPFPANAEPDTADPSSDALVTVSDIRLGRHDGFDRVVFEVGGTGTPGLGRALRRRRRRPRAAATPVDVAGDAVAPGDPHRHRLPVRHRRRGVRGPDPLSVRGHRGRHRGRLRRHLRGARRSRSSARPGRRRSASTCWRTRRAWCVEVADPSADRGGQPSEAVSSTASSVTLVH